MKRPPQQRVSWPVGSELIPRHRERVAALHPLGAAGVEPALPLLAGSVGPALRVDEPARLLLDVVVADGRGGIRWVPVSRLQAVETVFAMTVHKSQGSEFDHVALVLPTHASPVLTRELVYTAITRARQRFTLALPGQDLGVLAQAIGRQVRLAGTPAA